MKILPPTLIEKMDCWCLTILSIRVLEATDLAAKEQTYGVLLLRVGQDYKLIFLARHGPGPTFLHAHKSNKFLQVFEGNTSSMNLYYNIKHLGLCAPKKTLDFGLGGEEKNLEKGGAKKHI
jgi:hypothetical protein